MLHRISRLAIALACTAFLMSRAAGQNQEAPAPKKPAAAAEAPPRPQKESPEAQYRESLGKRAEEEYKQRYKHPETAAEYWAAIKYEIEVGRFGLASELIKGLLDVTKDEQAKDLLPLEEQDGLSAFLRLRVVPTWVDDPNLDKSVRDKINKETRANVEELIARVSSVLQKFLTDPARVQQLIKTLGASDEDRAYALKELKRSGAIVVPYLIEALQQTPASDEMHQILMDTLVHLDQNAELPLLAALDLNDDGLRIELIDILRKRADPRAVADLWHIAATQPAGASKQAVQAIAYFLGKPQIPPAKVALSQEANRYYEHQVTFPNPEAVSIWRVENNQLKSATLTASQAEEYYALHYARQALDIDPAYETAQIIFLSAALEKAYERGGIDQPLEKGAPAVKELLRVVNSNLLKAVLQRALQEHRVAVILGAVRALGDRGELSAAFPDVNGPALLVRALDYPDRRVQIAAADGLLRMPGQPNYGAKGRVVDILRRALGGSTAAVVLVGDSNPTRSNDVVRGLREAGYQAVEARSGREVMSRLNQAADVDLVLVDAGISYPELPFLLGQLRADINSGLLPVVVTVPENQAGSQQRQERLQRMVEHYRNVWVIPTSYAPANLKLAVASHIAEAGTKALSEDERRNAAGMAIYWLKRMATGETPGYDVSSAEPEILNALNSDDLAALAIEAVERMHDPEAQRSLARLVLNTSRRPELRAAAAYALGRNIEEYGARLSAAQVAEIDRLFRGLGEDPKAKNLRASVGLVIGSLRPSAERTGTRLQGYAPALGTPAAAPAPAPEKESPAPDKDKGDSDKDK